MRDGKQAMNDASPQRSDRETLADHYVASHLFANAAAIYAELRAERPNDHALALKLARACYHNGDFDAAGETLALLRAMGETSPEVDELESALASDRHDSEVGLRKDDSPRAWLRVGRTRVEVGRFSAAVEAFQRVIERRPNHFEALRALGDCLLRLGRPREAIARLRASAACDEATPGTWLTLARALMRCEDEERLGRETDAALDQALALDPDFAEALFERADRRLRRDLPGEREAVVEEMRALIETGGVEDSEIGAGACWRLARALGATRPGAAPEAIEPLRDALRLHADYGPAMRDLAEALILAGDTDEASALLWRLVYRNPTDPRPYAELAARCYAQLDAETLAEELRDRLAAAGVHRAAVVARLSVAFSDAGRRELLQAAYRRGHRLKNRVAVVTNRLLRWARHRPELPEETRGELDAIVTEQEAILADWLDALKDLRPPPRRFDSLDIRDPLRRALSDARLAHPGAFALRREVADAPLMINGDRDALYELFHNLIKNAFEAMGEEGALTVRARREGERAIVEIEDEGEGAADLERLFEEGFTTRTGGSGFGLPAARHNTRMHGGSLALSHGAAGGLIARVTLPVART